VLVLVVAVACLTVSACAPAQWIGDGPGESQTYRVRGKSTLLDVARHYDLGYVEVVAANPGVDPWLPGGGTRVALPDLHLPPSGKHEGVIVNLGDMRLYHFVEGEPMRSYPIGIGREGLTTPLGRTTIVRKMMNPTWRPTARMRRDDPTLPAEVPVIATSKPSAARPSATASPMPRRPPVMSATRRPPESVMEIASL